MNWAGFTQLELNVKADINLVLTVYGIDSLYNESTYNLINVTTYWKNFCIPVATLTNNGVDITQMLVIAFAVNDRASWPSWIYISLDDI